MKGKLQSSKNKKLIALVAAIVILLAGTVTGVTLFLKDDGSTSAAEYNNATQNNSTQEPTENNDPTQEPTENNNPTEEPGEINTPAEGEDQNSGTTPGQTGTGSATTTTAGTTAGTTQGTPEESITYHDRLVAEDFLVGWTPMGISAITDATGRYINSPKLEIEKASYTATDFTVNEELILPEETKYTAVQSGEMIIYEIRVRNIGNMVAKNIKIIDEVPEGMTVVEIGANGTEKDGKVQWVADIPVGTQANFKFAVIIDEKVEGTIKNVAVVNGNTTNETENPILKTEKIAEVTRKGETVTEEARPGDTIQYTIKLSNTGDKDALTKVTDILPDNTTLVENSITENGIEENRVITWKEVTVKAGEVKKISFKVTEVKQ